MRADGQKWLSLAPKLFISKQRDFPIMYDSYMLVQKAEKVLLYHHLLLKVRLRHYEGNSNQWIPEWNVPLTMGVDFE